MCQSVELSRERIRTIETKTEVHASDKAGKTTDFRNASTVGTDTSLGSIPVSCIWKDLFQMRQEEPFCSSMRTATAKRQRADPNRWTQKGQNETETVGKCCSGRFPVAIPDNLKAELDRLVKQNIISQFQSQPLGLQSSDCGKAGENENMYRPQRPKQESHAQPLSMPTLEDILPDLSKAQVFSVFDAKHGFWHVKLDNESSLLTTFNTPFGRYRWLRLPFGLNAAPEEFQRRQHQALEGLPGVKCIVDDVIVYGEGPTKEAAIRDHDQKVRNLMDRCREKNCDAIEIRSSLGQMRYPSWVI
ncbi:hypothetical protein BSL78_07726 [Apostichopus japonicus]|uniref:Reverse transcriptase domain-containing protein n=1 Tax=Stichopus japonicus TaxID=307972 RepID=A0A2G8L513_STIJA|nr:hypothetical protein BSL78_07726 [Apostichopus japonicus]